MYPIVLSWNAYAQKILEKITIEFKKEIISLTAFYDEKSWKQIFKPKNAFFSVFEQFLEILPINKCILALNISGVNENTIEKWRDIKKCNWRWLQQLQQKLMILLLQRLSENFFN